MNCRERGLAFNFAVQYPPEKLPALPDLAAKLVCNANAEIANRRSCAGVRRICRGVHKSQSFKVGVSVFNSYRKELVLGEDDPARASPPTLSVLFSDIRSNYFRLYLNFMYFNIGRIVYLQTDVIFPYVLLAPTIIAGKITLGAMNQILKAFTQVRTSFQYLVNSWSTIVELISIYQRLRGLRQGSTVSRCRRSRHKRSQPQDPRRLAARWNAGNAAWLEKRETELATPGALERLAISDPPLCDIIDPYIAESKIGDRSYQGAGPARD